MSEVEISPDGKTLAALQSSASGTAIVFYDLANPGVAPTGVGLGDAKGRSVKWADDDRVLLLASRAYNLTLNTGLKRLEIWRWLSVSKSKRSAKMIFGNDPGYYNTDPGDLLATPPGSGTAYFARHTAKASVQFQGGGAGAVRTNRDTAWGYSLFAVDLASAAEKQIANGKPETVGWLVDARGAPLMRVDYDADQGKRKIFRITPGGGAEEVFSVAEGPADDTSFTLIGLAPVAGKALATRLLNGRRAVVYFDLATATFGEEAQDLPPGEIDDFAMDYAKAAPFAALYTDDLPRGWPLDPQLRKIQSNLSAAVPNGAPLIRSGSADGSKFVVDVVYPNHPKQFFLFDRPAKALNMIAPSYDKLDGTVVARKEKYDYVSADGLSIPGYLTVPKGAAKANMPLIVLPHGGPAGRDDMSFDWWPFFYAARGYLVYQPNFRGSDGYGRAFRDAGDGEWGRKMQDDITEGVKHLVADKIVDPKRICIVGGSYGGYAALAGATLTPDLYACAVSVGGVSDLPELIGDRANGSRFVDEYFTKRIGSRFRDTKELNAVSPAQLADQAKAPILLIHGKDDTVVPPGQSRLMYEALKKAGKPVEYVELPGEDHWLSTGPMRTEMLRRSIVFIDKAIGPK